MGKMLRLLGASQEQRVQLANVYKGMAGLKCAALGMAGLKCAALGMAGLKCAALALQD